MLAWVVAARTDGDRPKKPGFLKKPGLKTGVSAELLLLVTNYRDKQRAIAIPQTDPRLAQKPGFSEKPGFYFGGKERSLQGHK